MRDQNFPHAQAGSYGQRPSPRASRPSCARRNRLLQLCVWCLRARANLPSGLWCGQPAGSCRFTGTPTAECTNRTHDNSISEPSQCSGAHGIEHANACMCAHSHACMAHVMRNDHHAEKSFQTLPSCSLSSLSFSFPHQWHPQPQFARIDYHPQGAGWLARSAWEHRSRLWRQREACRCQGSFLISWCYWCSLHEYICLCIWAHTVVYSYVYLHMCVPIKIYQHTHTHASECCCHGPVCICAILRICTHIYTHTCPKFLSCRYFESWEDRIGIGTRAHIQKMCKCRHVHDVFDIYSCFRMICVIYQHVCGMTRLCKCFGMFRYTIFRQLQ